MERPPSIKNNQAMMLKQPIQHVLAQLTETLNQLTNDQYVQPSKMLFDATIGHHIRHIIELFQCLEKGYHDGVVSYEKRKRDHTIETSKELAIALIKEIYKHIEKPDKEILLEAEDYNATMETVLIRSNYYREIAYNLEHAIHHMALIRVGVNEVSSVILPEEFGVAYSTIKYRQQCVQ